MGHLTLQKACNHQIDIVLELLKKAAYWIQTKDIDYWQDWINPPQHFVDWIEAGFFRDEFYFVILEERIIGCFRLQWDDELFWGKQQPDSGYIHSFTIDREYSGHGIGKDVLAMIETMCLDND